MQTVAKNDVARSVQMNTERSESATTRWLADSTFVTLIPKKLKKPIDILSKKCERFLAATPA